MGRINIKDNLFCAALDAFPSPVLIVDNEIEIHGFNEAAHEIFGLTESEISLRSGEAIHCVNTKNPLHRCGGSADCSKCIIRMSVASAFSGKKVHRRKCTLRIIRKRKKIEVHYLITATPFKHGHKEYVLLVLEDINELMELKSLIPMCAWCKKVRNDENYWENVENYFTKHLDLDFSHGICNECMKKHFPDHEPNSAV